MEGDGEKIPQRNGKEGGREHDSGEGKPNLLQTCVYSQTEKKLSCTGDMFPLHLQRHDVQLNVTKRALTQECPAFF